MSKLQILSASESREFQTMEKVVDSNANLKGRDASWELWSALRVIRSGRLYRENHRSFYSYLKSKGLDQSYVSRGISALGVKELIEEKAWLYDKNKVGMIMSERCLRELVGVDEDSLPEVFRIAAEDSKDGPVTHRLLRDARTKLSLRSMRRKVDRTDDSGEQVPDILADAFRARYLLSDVSSRIKSIVLELHGIASRPGGEYLPFEEIHLELSRISNAISLAGFGITCKGCTGAGCDKCKDTGYIPKRRLREE